MPQVNLEVAGDWLAIEAATDFSLEFRGVLWYNITVNG